LPSLQEIATEDEKINWYPVHCEYVAASHALLAEYDIIAVNVTRTTPFYFCQQVLRI